MSRPAPTTPKPRLLPVWAEKFSSVVSWIASTWRPRAASAV